MNASQTNSSTQIKDLWPSLVTTQSQKFERPCFIKHMQHHNGSTNDPFSPSHLYKQQQPTKKKPLLIRLSHVKTIKLLSNQRMIPFLGTFQFCFLCWFYLSISKTLFGALTHQILFQGKELVVAPWIACWMGRVGVGVWDSTMVFMIRNGVCEFFPISFTLKYP